MFAKMTHHGFRKGFLHDREIGETLMKTKRMRTCLLSALALVASTASAALNVTVEQYTSGNPATGENGHFPIASADLGQTAGNVIDVTGTINTYDSQFTDKGVSI